MTRVRVVRAEDLFVCDLEFLGIDVVGSAPDRIMTASPGGAPAIVVHLPPQHVAEAAFPEEEPPHETVFVPSRAAAPSRVAFRIDPSVLPVDYKLPAVLELLAHSALLVPATAARRQQPSGFRNIVALIQYLFDPPGLAEPGTAETAIELPFRLVLSPEEEAGFEHMSLPVRGAGATRAELWHSLLRPAPDRNGQRQVRAIWLRQGDGPAWDPNQPKWTSLDEDKHEPFPRTVRNTMSQRQRADIVHLSGNRRYGLQTGTEYEPEPIAVSRLALTALGGWLDSHGEWSPPRSDTSLAGWTHRTSQGRDQFVRKVAQGFLYPFGHLAAMVHVSERKFVEQHPPLGDPPLLLEPMFIVVRQPVKSFLPGAAPSQQAHTMPLHEIRLRTLVTPDLELSDDNNDNCFLIRAKETHEPFQFKLTGTDEEGNTVDLATPLVWISSTLAWERDTINQAATDYGAMRRLDAHGAGIAFAPGPDGDTTYPTKWISFTAPPQDPMPPKPAGPPADHQPGFWPELAAAEVTAPALQIIAGSNEPAVIEYHPIFRDNGLGGRNVNEVITLLRLPRKLALDFSTKGDRAGGLIQPSMSVAALSRQLGPVGGDPEKVADLAAGKFDPSAFFAGAKLPRLFGVIDLQHVLAPLIGALPSDLPRMVTQSTDKSLVAREVWNPVLTNFPETDPIFVVDAATKMEIDATFDMRSKPPTSDVHTTITSFHVHLLGGPDDPGDSQPSNPTFLKIGFEKVEFAASTGSKPDVDVKMSDVVFAGPLLFVERLRELIPPGGFSDPPAIDITPAGVRSSYSLGLPNVAVGVFSLQNLSFGAGFAIPFVDGALTVNFAFCRREEPFLLTVAMFGGGGFFNLAIDPNGVQQLEAAIEFGASCAVNLGVAQGGVHVMAGIYFKLESKTGCRLTGYLRLGGNMSVLGLISVCVELSLSFTYKAVGKAYGRAVITVEIDIFLFSTSVEIECERQFAGTANDPAFEQLMPPGPWHEYCEAFADA